MAEFFAYIHGRAFACTYEHGDEVMRLVPMQHTGLGIRLSDDTAVQTLRDHLEDMRLEDRVVYNLMTKTEGDLFYVGFNMTAPLDAAQKSAIAEVLGTQ